jgi:hypothetical protein
VQLTLVFIFILVVVTTRAEVVFVAAKGVAIPIFVRQRPQPVLVIRIDRVFKDYQRKGFFRIGILPQVVGEGVTFEILDGKYAPAALCEARALLFAMKKEAAIELRGVTFRTRGSTVPFLQARMCHFDAEGLWQFRDGSLSNSVHFSRASLHPTGLLAGQFRAETGDSTIRMNLLAPQSAQ